MCQNSCWFFYWHIVSCPFHLCLENPLTVDSKDPTESYQDFIKGENRYASLLRQFPDVAPALFEESEAEAHKRLETYKRMAGK